MALAGRIERTINAAAAAGGDLAEYGVQLKAQLDRLGQVTFGLVSLGDPEKMMANATTYLEAAGHLVVAWIWLEQLLAVGSQPGDFYSGKRQAGRYFFATEIPKIGPMMDLVAAGDLTSYEMQDAWF